LTWFKRGPPGVRENDAMPYALLAAPALSFLVLGAHFLRDGGVILPAVCVVLALLPAWRRPWVPRLLQGALLLGTLEWAWTAFYLVQQRIAEARPWGRMALILGVVALVTAASIAALEVLRRRGRFAAEFGDGSTHPEASQAGSPDTGARA
jgi:hypothetical protein